MIHRPNIWWHLGLLLTICVSCTKFPSQPPEFDNSLDEENPDYIQPETNILSGPVGGMVVNVNTVTFRCSGNAQITEFAFRLNRSTWSEWQTSPTITLDYLSEGDQIFEVKGRYDNGDEDESPAVATFTTDAIQGPGLIFEPTYISSYYWLVFPVNVCLEEVVGVKGLRAEINYDASMFVVDDVSPYAAEDGLFNRFGGQVILFYDLDATNGTITIEMATALGINTTVSGSGPVATIRFRSRRVGTSTLDFGANCVLRDEDNIEIQMNEMGDAYIQIQ